MAWKSPGLAVSPVGEISSVMNSAPPTTTGWARHETIRAARDGSLGLEYGRGGP